MSSKKMVIAMEKYICIFCDERKPIETAEIICGKIGICHNCCGKLSRTPYSLPYKGTKNISYIMSPFEYRGGIRDTIIDFKFHGHSAYAPLFAAMMKDYLDSYDVWNTFDGIIPVPLHKNRLKERGYNQSELISEHISKQLGLTHITNGISRIRSTKRQSTLEKPDRIKNVQNAFTCTTDFTGKKILLFDDICTTGSTLEACASALTDAGAEYICALTFAIYTEQKLPIITY